jgi:hypothetical protein
MSTWATILFALPPVRSATLRLAALPTHEPPAIVSVVLPGK